MNRYKYQIIKLKLAQYNVPGVLISPTGPSLYTIPENTLPFKDYNNIAAFRFYSPRSADPMGTLINLIEISDFRISGYEVVGERTPFKIFAVGNSIKHEDRYTEVNIPNNLQQVKCTLSAKHGAPNDIYLILRLNNVKEDQHFKNYHRYETKVFELINNPPDEVKKFTFRPKAGVSILKGVSVNFINHSHQFWSGSPGFGGGGGGFTYYPYPGIPVTPPGPVGKVSLQLNNLKSNPILINCKDYVFAGVERKIEFLELNEPLLTSSDIDGYFINSPQLSISLANLTMYLTHKYSIKK